VRKDKTVDEGFFPVKRTLSAPSIINVLLFLVAHAEGVESFNRWKIARKISQKQYYFSLFCDIILFHREVL